MKKMLRIAGLALFCAIFILILYPSQVFASEQGEVVYSSPTEQLEYKYVFSGARHEVLQSKPNQPFAQLVVNGGFEYGNLNGWLAGGVVQPKVYPNLQDLVVHSGTYAAFLGDVRSDGRIYTYTGDSWIYQEVEIPKGSTNVRLSAWYFAASYDDRGHGDYVECQIKDSQGNNLATPMFRTFDGEVHGPWMEITCNLDSFVGQKIRIYFNCHDDGYYYYDFWGNRITEPTALAVDDVYIYFDPEAIPPHSTHTLQGSLGGGSWYLSDVNIGLSASDAESGIAKICYKIDTNQLVEVASSSTSFKITDNGVHTVEYYAVDKAGNEEQPHNFVEVKIDKIAPTTTYSQVPTSPDPLTNWYSQKVKVKLTASDNTGGSGVARICYKIDNSGWQVYTGEFELSDGVHTVTYNSTDVAGNKEQPKSVSNIKVDIGAPETVHTISGKAGECGWYVDNVKVELTSKDSGCGVAYTNYKFTTEDVWHTYDAPIPIDSDGTYTIQYYSVDNIGNTEQTKEVTVQIDKTPPLVASKLTGTKGLTDWYVSAVKIEFNIVDLQSGVNFTKTKYSINDAPPEQYVNKIEFFSSGIYKIKLFASDMAGNTIENITEIKIDFIPPAIDYKLEGPAGNEGWYRGDVKITFTSTDALAGVDKIWYRCSQLRGNTSNIWLVYEDKITLQDDGVYVIEYSVTDFAGNWNGSEAMPLKLQVKIDKTPPSILHTPIKECAAGEKIKLTASIYDSTAGVAPDSIKVWYKCGDLPWQYANMNSTGKTNEYCAIISSEKIKGDKVEYYIEAADLAGNSVTKFSRSAPQKIDIIGPNWALLLLLIPILFLIFLIIMWARRRRAEREAIEPLRAAKLEELARRRRERGDVFSGFGEPPYPPY